MPVHLEHAELLPTERRHEPCCHMHAIIVGDQHLPLALAHNLVRDFVRARLAPLLVHAIAGRLHLDRSHVSDDDRVKVRVKRVIAARPEHILADLHAQLLCGPVGNAALNHLPKLGRVVPFKCHHAVLLLEPQVVLTARVVSEQGGDVAAANALLPSFPLLFRDRHSRLLPVTVLALPRSSSTDTSQAAHQSGSLRSTHR